MVSAIIFEGRLYRDCADLAVELDMPVDYVRKCATFGKHGIRRVPRVYRVTDKKGRILVCWKGEKWWVPVDEKEKPMKIQWADVIEDITLAHYLQGGTVSKMSEL